MGRRFAVLLILSSFAVSGPAGADTIRTGGPGTPLQGSGINAVVNIFEGSNPSECKGASGRGEIRTCPILSAAGANLEVQAGFIVLCEDTALENSCDTKGISDVLLFTHITDSQGRHDFVRLFSDPLIPSLPKTGVDYFSESASKSPVTAITKRNLLGGMIEYEVHSDINETEVPEPGTLLLFSSGLVTMVGVMRGKLRK